MNPLFLRLIHPFSIKEPLKVQKNDLQEIKALSLNHNLFPLVYTQLQRYRNFISPNRIINDFLEESRGLYLKSIILSARQEAVENEIISLLRKRGIPAALIKGNSIAKEIYEDLNCRTSADIDILIRRRDAIKIDSVLSKAGYIGDSDIPLIYCLSRIHHTTYYHPQNNIPIEIHWRFGIPYFFKITSEEIWIEVIFADSGQARLTPEMLIIMLLIHHHSHSFRELKILVDILRGLHKYDNEIDWYEFAKRLRKIGLLKSTQIILNQIRSLWKETAEEMKSVHILQQEINNMSYKTPKFLVSYFCKDVDNHRTSNIYKDKLIARFALDKLSTTILSYFKTLFPLPEAIKELYKDQRNVMLPFNYAKFIHWRVKEWLS